jgi:hypothetical protein
MCALRERQQAIFGRIRESSQTPAAGIKAWERVYIGEETKPVHGSRELTGEGRFEPKWAD